MSGLDLYTTQRALALMFVYAAITGFFLGGVYDILRILRALLGFPDQNAGSSPQPGWRAVLFAEDVLFMLVASVAFILLCYYTNDGQLRAPALVGMACGFFVYRYTVGALTRRLTPPFVRIVRSLVRLALSPIRIPLKWIAGLTVRAWKGLRRRLTLQRAARQEDTDTSSPTDELSPPTAENNAASA